MLLRDVQRINRRFGPTGAFEQPGDEPLDRFQEFFLRKVHAAIGVRVGD